MIMYDFFFFTMKLDTAKHMVLNGTLLHITL